MRGNMVHRFYHLDCGYLIACGNLCTAGMLDAEHLINKQCSSVRKEMTPRTHFFPIASTCRRPARIPYSAYSDYR